MVVGFRFHPTGEELINYYLKNKILGKSWLTDNAISEIDFCSYDPIFLPSLSQMETNDLEWYFSSPKMYSNANKRDLKRTTPSGFWKVTGKDREIKDRRGNGVVIGIKKTVVYYQGRTPNGVRTPWVMHEYHITCLPLSQTTHVICKVMYNGEDGDILYGNGYNSSFSEPSHSLVSDSNTLRAINTNTAPEPGQESLDGMSVDELFNLISEQDVSPSDGFNPDTLFTDSNNTSLQPQTHDDNEYWSRLYNGGNYVDVFPNPELIMQENHNNYRPKKPLSGFIDSDSESDAESISATSYQETPSPGDTIGSSNRHFPSCSKTDSLKEDQLTLESQLTCRTTPSKQEVKQGKSKAVVAIIDKETSMVKTEKKIWFIREDAMERKGKTPRFVYLMNTIIGSILFVALICDISYRFY